MLLVAACGPSLPDPDSPGARIYRARCAGCHRLYAPGSMTAATWQFQVDRMRVELARRGSTWLTAEEERTLREYLTSHGGSG